MSDINKGIKQFDVDKVIEFIGPLGKWQWFQNILLFFVGVTAGIGAVTFAFTGYMPSHRCFVPICENVTTADYSWIHKSQPFDLFFEDNLFNSFFKVYYRFYLFSLTILPDILCAFNLF